MLVCVVLSCLFLVALLSPAGKGLTSKLSGLLWSAVCYSTSIYIYIIHAAVTLDYYSAGGGGGGGGCCIRKRENDRKARSIVDRKPEKV